MKLKRFLIAGLLTIAAMVQAQQMPDLPMDPAVRMGKLDNGLTYYVRQNGWPENRVNFYIAQRVGSIQENDDQRGLAHFLEHMAFNGSDNFPGNDLIEFTRSIGVEFGSDLNAYTGIDQTVYRICNVPSGRIETLDSCMLILRDWSCGLLLEADEIQKERGVIHEEWRLRTSPIMRMLERNLEALYPGSKYGQRMPIGKMEIIDNFEPQVLRDYYHKWYRPDNQAIIIVGDIDVDRTEAKIKEMFGNIKLDPNAAQVVEEQVPDNAEPIIIIDKDKEQQMTIVELMFKHDPTPKEAKANMMYMLESYAKHMAVVMLNQRMSEKALDPECPYISASCSDGNFFLASTKESFGLDVLPKEGRTEEALAAAYREALRAAKFGFTATEYARAKEEYMSQLEKIYTNRNKRDNSVFGDACRDHYLENEPILDIETEYQMMNMLTPQLPVEMINQILPELVSTTDENLVIMCFNQEKDGATYPTKETFLNAISGVRSEQLEAYVDNVKDEPLMTKLPKKGKIKSERMVNELGYKELILSNGAKVLLKKTDYKDDQILMTAVSKGGASLYGEADYMNTAFVDAATASSGLGAFDNTQLDKALAGKQASVSFGLQNLHETVSGNCVPKDLETMMQLTYLTFTDIKKDEKAYQSFYNMIENALKNRDLDPQSAFADSMQATLYDRNPRFKSPTVDDLKKLNYDRMLQIAKERMANAGDFTFAFVGNFDEATIRPLIEQYIASLPGKAKNKEEWKKVSTYHQGAAVNKFTRKMETPKANAYMYWYNNTVPYTLENGIKASAAGQVLEMIYLKKIREDASAAYSANAIGQATCGGDIPMTMIVGVCPLNPEKADLATQIMRDEAKAMCETVDAEMLKKVKEAMLNKYEENGKRNGYWMDIITDYDELGIDKYNNYKEIVNALTPESIAAFMRDVIFAGGNSVEVIMLPE